MVNIHSHIFYTAMLTAMLVASQGKLTLLFPIRAIIAVSSALPAVMVWAPMMGIKAFVATVFGRHTRRLCLAIESVAAMLTDKLLGMAFHGGKVAGAAAIVPNGIRRSSIKGELLATPLTDKFDEWMLSHGCAMRFAFAFTRATLALSFGRIKEDFAANRADVFDAGNTSGHSDTSGSINRDLYGGTFPGKNACQQIASLPKPRTKYTTIGQMCQGGAYAKC